MYKVIGVMRGQCPACAAATMYQLSIVEVTVCGGTNNKHVWYDEDLECLYQTASWMRNTVAGFRCFRNAALLTQVNPIEKKRYQDEVKRRLYATA